MNCQYSHFQGNWQSPSLQTDGMFGKELNDSKASLTLSSLLNRLMEIGLGHFVTCIFLPGNPLNLNISALLIIGSGWGNF